VQGGLVAFRRIVAHDAEPSGVPTYSQGRRHAAFETRPFRSPLRSTPKTGAIVGFNRAATTPRGGDGPIRSIVGLSDLLKPSARPSSSLGRAGSHNCKIFVERPHCSA